MNKLLPVLFSIFCTTTLMAAETADKPATPPEDTASTHARSMWTLGFATNLEETPTGFEGHHYGIDSWFYRKDPIKLYSFLMAINLFSKEIRSPYTDFKFRHSDNQLSFGIVYVASTNVDFGGAVNFISSSTASGSGINDTSEYKLFDGSWQIGMTTILANRFGLSAKMYFPPDKVDATTFLGIAIRSR